MYVPRIAYNLLFRPTNAQYVVSNVYFFKFSDMLRCIDVVFRESYLIYAEVTKLQSFVTSAIIKTTL